MTEREHFEAVYVEIYRKHFSMRKGHDLTALFDRTRDGAYYLNDFTELAHLAWQAAKADQEEHITKART